MKLGYTAEDQQIIADAAWQYGKADAKKAFGLWSPSYGYRAVAFTDSLRVTQELMRRVGLINDGPEQTIANGFGAMVSGEKNLARLKQLGVPLETMARNIDTSRSSKPCQRD